MSPAARRRSRIVLALVVFLLVASWFGESASAAARYAPGRILVKFRPSATKPQMRSLTRRLGATESGTIRPLGIHVLRVAPTRVGATLKALRASRLVRFAERDAILRPQEILPNDPYFLNSGAWNISGGAWGWYQTHTTEAWDISREARVSSWPFSTRA